MKNLYKKMLQLEQDISVCKNKNNFKMNNKYNLQNEQNISCCAQNMSFYPYELNSIHNIYSIKEAKKMALNYTDITLDPFLPMHRGFIIFNARTRLFYQWTLLPMHDYTFKKKNFF
jgi:hypothetical protein